MGACPMSTDTKDAKKAKRAGFNLNARVVELAKEERGSWRQILDEMDQPTGAYVHIYGQYSAKVKEAEAWRRLKWKEYGRELTAEENRIVNAEMVARCCDGWREFIDDDEQPIEFTVERLRDVFIAWPPAFKQLNEAITNHAYFLAEES